MQSEGRASYICTLMRRRIANHATAFYRSKEKSGTALQKWLLSYSHKMEIVRGADLCLSDSDLQASAQAQRWKRHERSREEAEIKEAQRRVHCFYRQKHGRKRWIVVEAVASSPRRLLARLESISKPCEEQERIWAGSVLVRNTASWFVRRTKWSVWSGVRRCWRAMRNLVTSFGLASALYNSTITVAYVSDAKGTKEAET